MSNLIRRWSREETLHRDYPNGNTWNGSWPKSGQHYLSYSKSSVDTGYFVPNEYRVNPYSVSRTVVKKANVSASYTAPLGTATDTCNLSGDIAVHGQYETSFLNLLDSCPNPGDTSLRQLALQRARGNVDASVLELGVELGELRETLNMLRNPFKDLRKLCDLTNARALRRSLQNYIRTGRFGSKRGKDAAKAAASTWMELRYGVRPLFNSIAAIAELAGEGFPVPKMDKIYSAHGKTSGKVGVDRLGNKLIANGTYTDVYAQVNVEHTVENHAAVQFRYLDIPTKAEYLGLAPQYIPEIMWELTRLSFVVDWFIGIGPWLGSLRCQPNISILGNTVSTKEVSTMTASAPYASYYYDAGTKRPASVSLDIRKESFNRAVNESGGGPQLIGGKLMDFSKSIDLLIILYQNIRF